MQKFLFIILGDKSNSNLKLISFLKIWSNIVYKNDYFTLAAADEER